MGLRSACSPRDHLRIGTFQASQYPGPTDPIYEQERTFFEDEWKCVVEHRTKQGDAATTVVPEYGGSNKIGWLIADMCHSVWRTLPLPAGTHLDFPL